MLVEYEKELDNSNKLIEGYEEYIGENKNKKDMLDKVCGDNVEEICSEKDQVNKKNSINRFFETLSNNKGEMQSNK